MPITLDLSLEGYYAATSLMGLLAGQSSEPDQEWVKKWAFTMGEKMAAEERRRRKRR